VFRARTKRAFSLSAEDYDSAVNQLNEPWPDLSSADWMCCQVASGIQFIATSKREAMTRDIPVMMLTARGEEEDVRARTETGADDYITKPFSPKELVARIKAVASYLADGGRRSH
jgi:two-component system phosphate regulon response regulator PhoB